MPKHSVSSYQLKIRALFIIYKLAHCARPKPYDRSWGLRFILAFLYSQSKAADRTHFDGFWKAATKPETPGAEERAPGAARRSRLQREANGICLAVGEEPKQIHDRFWDEMTREAYAGTGDKLSIKR